MHRSKLALLLAAALAFGFTTSRSYGSTLNVLTSFNNSTDGRTPQGSLTLIGSTLYGMTQYGGPGPNYLGGTIFSIPTTGGTPTVLAPFNNYNNGIVPRGSLTPSADGSTLYGTTSNAGAGGHDQGTVFSIPATGGTPTLVSFFNGTDGANPQASLTLSGSTLYGTTQFGGVNNDGTVFSVPTTGGMPTVLASFNGTDGNAPLGSLTLSGSTLYGTTFSQTSSPGEIFSVPVAGGTPTIVALFNGTDGSNPEGSLILSADGSTLYGMTAYGGANEVGTIFSVPVTGGTPTVLASFNGTNGANPFGDLTLSGSILYGMTSAGGANNDGTIFSIPTTGGTPTVLASFNGTNGAAPYGDLTLSGSTLYGMTSAGGANGDGTVFSLATPEPSSVVLLGLGSIGLGSLALRRKFANGRSRSQ